MSVRPVKRIVDAVPTIEGAGVKLRRAFGFGDTTEFDFFLVSKLRDGTLTKHR